MSASDKTNLLVVCGPTASGKTALAVQLARYFGGEIISADSRQVYRGLDIGSGKDLFEYTVDGITLPYHLIDIADPKDIYTLYHYQKDFYRCFKAITAREKLPVLCGGTGLYIEAVLRHYDVPEVPEDPEMRTELMAQPREALEKRLLSKAPDLYDKTDLSSKKRIVRALEVAYHRSGTSPEKTWSVSPPEFYPFILCTHWPRGKLLERIDRRLHDRLRQGMVEEVEGLRKEGVPDERLFMLGMEYKFITRYLRNEIDYAAMIEQLAHSIHRLSKRQVTWFRGMERRGLNVHWVDGADVASAREMVEIGLGKIR